MTLIALILTPKVQTIETITTANAQQDWHLFWLLAFVTAPLSLQSKDSGSPPLPSAK